jgi:hypothetical protein
MVEVAGALAWQGNRTRARELMSTLAVPPGTAERILSPLGQRRARTQLVPQPRRCRRSDYVLAAYVNAALGMSPDRAERVLREQDAPEHVIGLVRRCIRGMEKLGKTVGVRRDSGKWTVLAEPRIARRWPTTSRPSPGNTFDW